MTTKNQRASAVADKYISKNGGPPDIDRVVEIEQLAALDPIEFDVARPEAAKRLGIRATTLESEVKKKRRELGLDTKKDDGQGRAITITDVLPWHEPVSGDRIATTIAAALKTYAVFPVPDAVADAISLWGLHTWVLNAFDISPRLAITSPTKGCGKTTVLRVLEKIVRRPKRAVSITPAALFRFVELFQPTTLLDETEKYIEYGSPLHGLLNGGHLKGDSIIRVLGDNQELREFAVFGAVAFCHNGKLPDDLEQRSIIIEMQRRLVDEQLTELRSDRCESLDQIARMCSRWADDNAGLISDQDPDMGTLINRYRDNWRPLFAIADLIGSDWPERIREAASVLVPKDADSKRTTLLANIKTIFDEQTGEWSDRMFSEQLAEALAAIEGGLWAEYGKTRKPITKNQLAHELSHFRGLSPTSVRIGTKSVRGYYRHQFEELWRRYGAPQGVNETPQCHKPTAAGTSTTFPNATTDSAVAFQKDEKPLRPNSCGVVAFQRGDNPDNNAVMGYAISLGLNCAQCRGGPVTGQDAPTVRVQEGLLVHPECRQYWLKAQAGDDLNIPPFLRRSA